MPEKWYLSILYYHNGWQVDLTFTHWYNMVFFLMIIAVKAVLLELVARRISKSPRITFISQGATALRGIPTLGASLTAIYAVLVYILGSDSHIVTSQIDPLMTACALFTYLLFAARYARIVMRHALKNESGLKATSILINIPTIIIYILGIIFILSNFGISLTPLITAMGFSGFMAVFAMQNSLGNMFAGIFILLSKKFKVGDYILLGTGEMGYVVDINWMNTSLKAGSENIVIIPNSKISDSVITNYSWPTKELRITLEFSVPYSSDLKMVEQYINELMNDFAATEHIGESTVHFNACGELGIHVAINVSVDDFDAKEKLRHDLIKAVQAKLMKNGIIMGGAKK